MIETIESRAAQALYAACDGSIRPGAFTCDESDAIVAFLRKHLGQFEANVWATDHANSDEEGDRHYHPRGGEG